MKTLLQAGIGNFGRWWFELLQERTDLRVIIADPRSDALQESINSRVMVYPSVEQALSDQAPDLILNTTPPKIHTRINHLAFDHRIPVLCEKPICEDYSEATEIVDRAVREGHLFMIAENYRRAPAMRKLRESIEAGLVGELSAIYVTFAKEFFEDKAYFLAMPHPLLQDVAIHHLDCIRYMAGDEARRLSAWNFNPRFSKFAGNAALNFQLEMRNDLPVTFCGSLQAKGVETDWLGNWRIEGTKGVLMYDGSSIRCYGKEHPDEVSTIPFASDGHHVQNAILDEFLQAIKTRTEPETSAADYLKSQALVHWAIQSSDRGCVIDLD